jgi:hypothetical protein
MRSSIFWVVTRRVVVKMGSKVCPETPVRIYYYTLRNNPEEGRTQGTGKVADGEGYIERRRWVRKY